MSNFKKFVAGFSTIALAVSMLVVPVAKVDAATAGEVYKTTDGTVHFITKDMQRRAFTSYGAFLSYGFLSASQIKEADSSVTSLPAGAFVAPQDGRIFCATETKGTDVAGECALITGGKKAAFTSSAVFTGQGYSFNRAFYGDSSFLEKTSNVDNASAQHRPGTLINNNGTVQLVVTGGLWGVPSMDVFNSWGWSFADVVPANSADVLLSQTGVIPARMAGELVPTASTGNGGGSTGNCNDLQGSAGSITVDSLNDYSNEEVGEGEDDVEVMAFEVEADDDSDVNVTSIKVELDHTGAGSEDLDDYATEVSVWHDGDMIASADADEFTETDDDKWTKTLSLDCAFVGSDEMEELVIAVSALDTIDSNDLNETWTVDVLNVRFEDADGVTTTEDTDAETLEQTFTFEDFATAADTELVVSLDQEEDDINEAHVIDIDDTDDTDDTDVLAFTIEAEGDSDITINDLSINFDAVGVNLQDAVTNVTLSTGSEELGNEAITKNTATPGTDETIEFDDIDFTIDAGEEVSFVVSVDLKSIADGIVNGDTISAQLSGTERALIDADDEEGDQIDMTADSSGTAVGEAHGLFESGIMVELVSTNAVKANGEQGVNSDSGTFTIVFDVTAFDDDVYIDKTAPDTTGGATESDLNVTGAGTITGSIDSDADEGTEGFFVEEGTTERFTITVDIRDGGTDLVDGFFDVALGSLLYAVNADVDGDQVYNFNLEDYKTTQIFLDDRE